MTCNTTIRTVGLTMFHQALFYSLNRQSYMVGQVRGVAYLIVEF